MLQQVSYPLSAAQQLIFIQQKFDLDNSISNINILLHLEAEVNDELMLQALSIALLRNRSVSFQIREIDSNNYDQYYANSTPQPIEIVNFSHATEEELKNYLKKEGSQAFPNKGFDVPLYKVKYIVKPNGMRAIYYVVNHIISDQFSLMFMTDDALNIYEALCEGTPLPKPHRSALPLFDKEKEYLESEDYQNDLAFWDEVLADEPLYSSLYPAGSKDYTRNKRTGTNIYAGLKTKSASWMGEIPAELVEKTKKFAQEHEVSMQSLYMLPIRNALSRANNHAEDILLSNLVALRATILEKQAGGMRAMPIYLRLRFKNELSFTEAAKEMTNLYISDFRHSRCPYLPTYGKLKKRFDLGLTEGYDSVLVTFQPYALKERVNLPLRIEYIPNGQSSKALHINFVSLDNSGSLYGIYDYNLKAYKTPALIEKFHTYLLNSLDYAMD
ncbi:MAG: hypothetical protein GXY87_06345, partial [Tissierellia bacterium]|nr:hypothetical protein [Tissierellia bacterium]